MTALHTPFAPLVEITSTFLNIFQSGVFTQRGNGSANTMVSTLNTPSPLIRVKTVIFACNQSGLSPPFAGGLIDDTIDWRDRQLTIELEIDNDNDTRDIRWGKVDDDKQAQEQYHSVIYSRTGGTYLPISYNSKLSVYVDSTNGYLWLKKPVPVYLRGTISCSAQTRERS